MPRTETSTKEKAQSMTVGLEGKFATGLKVKAETFHPSCKKQLDELYNETGQRWI